MRIYDCVADYEDVYTILQMSDCEAVGIFVKVSLSFQISADRQWRPCITIECS